MNRRILLALGLLLVACNQKDTTAPPAPNVDPPTSPTGAAKVWITGSAEFASTVKLSGPTGDLQTTADPFTARFRFQVELKPGTANAFSLTATDAAGNVSEATAVTIESQPPHAAKLALAPRLREVRAGEQVALDVTMLDQYGNEFLDPAVTFEVTPTLPALANVAGTMKPQGVLPQSQQFVAYDLTAVAATGYTFSIKATSGAASAVTQLTVRPAAAVTFSKLSFAPTGTTATVAAGTDARYLYEVQDAFGNVTTGPVQVFTNAPGAILIDDGITGSGTAARLVSAGSYSLSFYIAGAGLKGTLQLEVGVAPAAAIDVMASTSLLGPNADMQVFARVRDQFGNPISCATATLADVAFTAKSASGTVVAPGASACFNGAFQATYRFTAEGTYAIDGEYKPGTLTPAVKGTVFVTVLSFDNTPPTVDIPQAQLRRNGQPCVFSGVPASCTVQPGDFIEFTVVADDNKALSELSYTAFFSTAGGTGTLRTRNVLIPANAALPYSQYFAFSVPNTTFFEDVNLAALAIDGAGNRATTAQLVLRVNFGTFGGRVATVVARDTGGNMVNGPEGVAVAANGDLFIANTGNGNILKVTAASLFPTVYVSSAALNAAVGGGFAPSALRVDGTGRLWATEMNGSPSVVQISAAATPAVTDYVFYPNGASAAGLALVGPTASKLVVNVGAVADGDRVVLAGTTYEVNSVDPCPATSTCVNVASLTASVVASGLAACISGGTGCTVGSPAGAAATANASVGATVSATPSPAVVIAARNAGAAGNLLAAGAPSCPRLSFNTGGCPGATALSEGHDETLFAGQNGSGGAGRSQVLRFALSLGPAYPKALSSNEGLFDMATAGPVDHEQVGLAVKDLGGPAARNLRDLTFYFPDATIGQSRLRGVRFVDGTPGATLFNSAAVGGGRPACTDCIRGTNDPTAAPRTFNSLWDAVLEPRPAGCLLVSDDGNGSIYAVDTRDPSVADPLVTLVAAGFGQPRGLAFGPSGDLFVALRSANAVLRIAPSADPTDCF